MNIRVRISKDEDGVYIGTCAALPGCVSQGKTKVEVVKNLKSAIKLHMRSLLEDGVPLMKKQKGEQILEVRI